MKGKFGFTGIFKNCDYPVSCIFLWSNAACFVFISVQSQTLVTPTTFQHPVFPPFCGKTPRVLPSTENPLFFLRHAYIYEEHFWFFSLSLLGNSVQFRIHFYFHANKEKKTPLLCRWTECAAAQSNAQHLTTFLYAAGIGTLNLIIWCCYIINFFLIDLLTLIISRYSLKAE